MIYCIIMRILIHGSDIRLLLNKMLILKQRKDRIGSLLLETPKFILQSEQEGKNENIID